MKNNNNGLYSQKYISPELSKLFNFFEKKPKVKNLKQYTKVLNVFVETHINYAKYVLRGIESNPIDSTEVLLKSLETLIYEALKLVYSINKECRDKYCLTKHEEKIIAYLQNKVESVWSSIDKLFCRVYHANYKLLLLEPEDAFPEEIPYKIDYSEILSLPMILN